MTQCIILAGGVELPPGAPKFQRGLGPYRIASALETAGYTTFVLDFLINLTIEEIRAALKLHLGPDTLWVGFSSTFFWKQRKSSDKKTNMYFSELEFIEQIIEYVKTNSQARLVYGGANAPYGLADDKIDYYIVGYADIAVVEFTNHLVANNIKQLENYEVIKVVDQDRVLIDSAKFPEPQMDQLTTQWWKPHYNVLQGEALPIELARGCIFRCKFCSYQLLGKKKGTYLRPSEQVQDDLIRMWETKGVDTYYITDDTFNDDNDKIEELHRIFTSLPFKPKFSCYLRIDLINKYPHQADLLAEMGLVGNYFGLETMQPKSATAIGKGLHPNKVKDRLYWLGEKWHMKVNMAAGFILGLPYDTKEYFKELYDWTRQPDNPLSYIDFYPLYLYNRQGENKDRLAAYSSEFSLNPEIYGYDFPRIDDKENYRDWVLDQNDLTYEKCEQTANWYRHQMQFRNKFAEFQFITAMNIGIPREDLHSMTIKEIMRKYPMEMMNTNKLQEYKNIIGIGDIK
jgi:radical SAM superfamily enzyme YgiQ (UPF0313 family)